MALISSNEGVTETKKLSVEDMVRLRLALDGSLATGAQEGFEERQGGGMQMKKNWICVLLQLKKV